MTQEINRKQEKAGDTTKTNPPKDPSLFPSPGSIFFKHSQNSQGSGYQTLATPDKEEERQQTFGKFK